MTETEKRGIRGSGRVAFWARRESIKKMLDDKYSLMATFLAHEKEVGISYGQFRLYVHKYIRSNNDNSTGNNRETDRRRDSASKKKPQVRTRSPDEPAFVSSDEPRSKDDLV